MSDARMDVAWDANKAQSNIAKHGITFAHVATMKTDNIVEVT